SYSQSEILRRQTESLNIAEFHKLGFTGKGIRVAIFDAGFPNTETNPALEHVIANKRIIATNDFIKNRTDVFKYNMHGTAVLSCVAGIYNGKPVGTAPDAEFLLARTESVGETIAEEEHWLAAAEWADKMGAHIINSSLGYTYHRYFPSQMNGEYSLISHAANMAVKKGILVVSSMGNDGDTDWKYLSTPADADSVLSVGAINPNTGYRSSFSSYGPTADNRIKPNVTAQGHVMAAEKGGLVGISGTSFSSPLVAGFAACALQSNRKLSAVELKNLIEKSGSLYPYFDYAHGFGVPNAKKFLKPELKTNTGAIKFEQTSEFIYLTVEKKLIKYGDNNYLYFHIENNNGFLLKYGLVKVEQENSHSVRIENNGNEKILRVHFNGYTEEYSIKEMVNY
ncbi:MAG TPA: hypothetical protein DCQ31_16225, partial [Bacteroidales bacterium]|nr:hypothetical protein [Bacteroidales bacterium]